MKWKPRKPRLPAVPKTPEPEFETPFYILVFGAVVSSTMCVGIVHALIRLPGRGTFWVYAFWVAFIVLSALAARSYTLQIVRRVRKWRGR